MILNAVLICHIVYCIKKTTAFEAKRLYILNLPCAFCC